MLPSSSRLRTKEVAEVLRRGRGMPSGKYLSAKVFYAPIKGNDTMRVAAVVSKKVAHTAIIRNRLRRALYDAIRHVSSEWHKTAKLGHVVFFIRSNPDTSLRAAFMVDIEKILTSQVTKN